MSFDTTHTIEHSIQMQYEAEHARLILGVHRHECPLCQDKKDADCDYIEQLAIIKTALDKIENHGRAVFEETNSEIERAEAITKDLDNGKLPECWGW